MTTATKPTPRATATNPAADPRPSPSSESIALAKLREAHSDEYDFYLKSAREAKTADWETLPDYPIKIQAFCLADYIKAVLDRAEYEPDGEVIFASVPGMPDFYSQGEDLEDARFHLGDAIEGSIVIALQMGWDIPQIPDSEVKIDIVEIDSP